MKKFQSSRGWRNNNPMNIRRTRTEWQGLVARQTRTDREFCQFLNRTWGYRAAYKVLKSYYKFFAQQGRECTIRAVVERWAPRTENDTEAYLRRVCELISYQYGGSESPESCLYGGNSASDDLHHAWLMAAMTCVECGCRPEDVDYQAICSGIMLAGGHKLNPEEVRL